MKHYNYLKLLSIAITLIFVGCEQMETIMKVDPTIEATIDYVDEYGINWGKGTAIGSTVWAPVNCGYNKTDYPYGKLYQWGRKYGQGYDKSDATHPQIDFTSLSYMRALEYGQSKTNENEFFVTDIRSGQICIKISSAKDTLITEFATNYDWVAQLNNGTWKAGINTLWNNGTIESPEKNSTNDPCPEGWRVPTYDELNYLRANCSPWSMNEEGHWGYWLCGQNPYSEETEKVFFPAAGYRIYYDGLAHLRGEYGNYWSSTPSGTLAHRLYFESDYVYMGNDYRAAGGSVRCVQE